MLRAGTEQLQMVKAHLMFRLRPMPTASLAAITLKPVRGALNSVACTNAILTINYSQTKKIGIV